MGGETEMEKLVEQQTKEFEIHTTLAIEPSLTINDVASALLGQTEYDASWRTRHMVIIKGINANMGLKTWNALKQMIKPEVIANKDIIFADSNSFNWHLAQNKIIKKYGLVKIQFKGTKKKVIGLVIGSKVTDNEQQVSKLKNIKKDLKRKYPKTSIMLDESACLKILACNLQDKKALGIE
jgi:hypothetical protein